MAVEKIRADSGGSLAHTSLWRSDHVVMPILIRMDVTHEAVLRTTNTAATQYYNKVDRYLGSKQPKVVVGPKAKKRNVIIDKDFPIYTCHDF